MQALIDKLSLGSSDQELLLLRLFGGHIKYLNYATYAGLFLGGSFITITLLAFLSNALFPRSFNYKNKHVLVTGGSAGIGLEIARNYLKKGAKVTIAARNEKTLKDAQADLLKSKPGAKVSILSVDVSKSYEAVEEKFREAVAENGDIDVLVNCAGVSICDEFETLSVAEYERMLRINVLGSMYPTRFVLPAMKNKQGGRIVFVSSQVAQAAIHGYTAYAASKWAIRGLAEALQMECAPHNIFVSVSYPPDTDTPGYKVEMTTKPELTKKISESGSVFQPQEVAADIVNSSTKGYFGVSNGFDGWLLKQLHPGMSPINSFFEVWQQIMFSGLARFISLFIISSWYSMASSVAKKNKKTK